MLSGIAVWVLRLMSTTGLGPAVPGGSRKICVSTLKLPSDVLDLQPPSKVRTNGVSNFQAGKMPISPAKTNIQITKVVLQISGH